jgi:hypothetical protein
MARQGMAVRRCNVAEHESVTSGTYWPESENSGHSAKA